MTRALKILAVLAVTLAATAWSPAPADHPLVGQPAPAMALKNYAGADVSLESFKGKQVMLVFWFPT